MPNQMTAALRIMRRAAAVVQSCPSVRGSAVAAQFVVNSVIPGNGVLLALLSAVLLVLSFPRFDLEFLAWIALVPLLLAIRRRNAVAAFGLSFITGFGFFVGISYWILVVEEFALLHFLPLEAYLGLNIALFGFAFNLLQSRYSAVVRAPVIWVFLEYLRSHAGFLEFPWALLGYSQYKNIYLVQFASITGAYGVSFLIVTINAAIYELILLLRQHKCARTSKVYKPAVVPVLLLLLAVAYGYGVIRQPLSTDTVTVSVIQANIPQVVKWKPHLREQHLQKHVDLSKEAAVTAQADLIVWPETAVQGSLAQERMLMNIIAGLAKETGSHLLVGVSVRPKFGTREFKIKNRFNSAQLISPAGQIAGQYNKIQLLPFAEYLPHKGIIPWTSNLTLLAGDFIRGTEYTLFDINGTKFSATICWESIFPNVFRQFVKNGANFMVNITNEAWFKETDGPYHFIPMNVFRAVENRISIARSANTGISGFIDPHGRIINTVRQGSKDIFVTGFLTMDIPLSRTRTFYTIYGDVFVYLVLIATLWLGIEKLWSTRSSCPALAWDEDGLNRVS
jgi:apolipoprotein N-acyltransferase